MVDEEFDSEPDDNNENKSYNQGSFEDRFPRPNAARVMQQPNRFPPPFMMRPGMRPGMRPQFNPRFDNSSTHRPEMFPPRLISYGPDKKNKPDEYGYRNMAPREFFNRPDMNNRFDLRHPNRDFSERNVRERPPFLNRFQAPRDNMQFQLPQRMQGNVNRFSSNRFPQAIRPIFNEQSDIEENRFLSSDEDEDVYNDTTDSKNKSQNEAVLEKSEISTENKPDNDMTLTDTDSINCINKNSSVETPKVNEIQNETKVCTTPEKTSSTSIIEKSSTPLVSASNTSPSIESQNDSKMNKSIIIESKSSSIDNALSIERQNCLSLTERQAFDRPNASPILGRTNVSQTPEKQNAPIFDRLNPSPTLGRSNATTFQRPNISSTFDRPNVPPTFDRSNVIQRFDRPNIPPFDKPNGPPFDRPNNQQVFERHNSAAMYDRSNASQTFDRPNAAPSFDRSHISQNFERGNPSQAFDRPNVPPVFDRSNAPQNFDRGNSSQPFERSNAIHNFDRPNIPETFDMSNVQTFERHGGPHTFDRQHAPSERPNHPVMYNRPNAPPMERPPFDRSNVPHQPMFERSNAPRMERPPMFERPNGPRMDHPPMFERPNGPRMDHNPMFERPGAPRMEQPPMFERPNAPRMDHPQMFERPNAPRMDHPQIFEQTGTSRMERPQMFERPNCPRFEHAHMFDRPTAPPMDHQTAMHNLPRPPQYPVSRLPPPHFPGMPPMPAQPPLPHSQGTVVTTATSNSSAPSTSGIPPIPFQGVPNMPPIYNRPGMPPFFDPRFGFMAHPHDRPMLPGFPMPGPFRPPFGHMPPPHLLHAPPLPIQADPSVAQSKIENALTIATLNEEEVWVQNPTADGRFYYYNLKTRQTNWEKPSDVRVITQTELNTILANKPQPIISSGPMQVTATTIAAPPQKPAEVAEWNEYKAPDGRPYFHNRRTAITTWDKPQVIIDWENECKGIKPSTNESRQSSDNIKGKEIEENTAATAVTIKDDSSEESNEEDEDDDEEGGGVGGDIGDSSKSRDKSKPVSSTPVSGTPWCIVWTGDGRVFFFNPAKRTSVWERPDELKGRTDVDKILDEPPKELSTTDKITDESKSSNEPPAKKQKIDDGKDTSDDISNDDVTGTMLGIVSATGMPGSNITTSEDHDDDQKMDTGTSHTESTEDTPIKDIVPLSKEAAKEAEERAAKERALLPLEVRMSQFREMLVEKQVSAFSTWEKELHKIVFDPRYLLLASRERKLAFENYVKDRAEEERRENKIQVRNKKEQFKKLLKEANLTSKSSFSDFMNKYSKDDRFKCIEKPRDRETMFQDYVADIRKKDKGDLYKDKTKQAYMSLLKEYKFNKNTHWGEARKRIDNDGRYKAVDSSLKREEWFKEYLKNKNGGGSRENSEVKRDREKRERQEASIREREKEVKESLSSALRDRDKERDYHLKTEAEQTFRVLLTDMIRNSDDSWKEVKRILRKDSRWEDVSNKLDRPVRDVILKDHMSALKKRSKKK